MHFDTPVSRIGTHSMKWDMMESRYGVPAAEGIAMWVADMEFRPPTCVQTALERMLAHGVYGYYGDDAEYLDAIRWWMATRHGWQVERNHIFTTNGLVHGTAMCVEAFSRPGDGIVLMTPVYHAFARIIKAAGRVVVECPLAQVAGRYEMDFAAWDAQMTGAERMLILCSPHNPGGRVWSRAELAQVAAFCQRHDLILVSDEIHHDLVYPGHTHTPMAVAAPEIADRLVMLTATTKTFNIAGGYTGNVTIADPALNARFADRMNAFGVSPNSFGVHMATAAYSPDGAVWVDALMQYLAGNQQVLNDGIAAMRGVRAMPLEATYLSWVDFSGTGMAPAEFIDRVQTQARIATNHGSSFGLGGAHFLRINIACPRAQVTEAVARLQAAFADLQ